MFGLLCLILLAGAAVCFVIAALIAWDVTQPPRRTAAYAVARNMAVDPGDAGLRFESWSLRRPDGAVMPVWDIAPGGAAATAPIVILIHGWGQSKIDMLARIEPWRSIASRLLLYDLRGHGESEGSICRLGERDDDDLLALLERLGDQSGRDATGLETRATGVESHATGRIILVGHSMGAVVAINAAVRSGGNHRIAGIVAFGAYTDPHVPILHRQRALYHPGRPFTDLALLILRTCGVRRLRALPVIRQLETPLLILHGENDAIVPPVEGRTIADAAPRATLTLVPGAGHNDLREKTPDLHDAAIRGFLESIGRFDAPITPHRSASASSS